jgi:hypothetical protein
MGAFKASFETINLHCPTLGDQHRAIRKGLTDRVTRYDPVVTLSG